MTGFISSFGSLLVPILEILSLISVMWVNVESKHQYFQSQKTFWGYPRRPMIIHTIDQLILDPKSKQDTVKVTKFKEFAKFFFLILKKPLHVTHLLKLLDKMCNYEMDPASIVEDTEQRWFCPQMDWQTRWNQYTPFQLRWAGGIKMTMHIL